MNDKNCHSGWFDGSMSGAMPEYMGAGFLIKNHLNEIITYDTLSLGKGTSSIAEWLALIGLLERAIDLNIQCLTVYGDNQAVIKQCQNVLTTGSEHIQFLKQRQLYLSSFIPSIRFIWVPRFLNSEADRLATKSLHLPIDKILSS